MNTPRIFLLRLRNLFLKERLDRDLQDELTSHLEMHIADNLRAGMSPEEARREALLRLGGLEQTKESVRDRQLLPWLDSLRHDAIFGYRQLVKNKVTSLAAILSLALAIGACTSAFRLIDAILLRPLPVSYPERLYSLGRSVNDFDDKPMDFDGWAYPDFQLMRDAAKGQADLLAISYADRVDLTYKSDLEMEKANLQYVSGNLFAAFGLQPVLGRLLTPDDDTTPGAHPVAVLSHDYWTRRFAQDPQVLGKTFRIGNNLFQIVGVSQSPFTGTEPGTMIDIFLPTMMRPDAIRKDSTWHRTFAIVQPGVAIEPLRAKLDSVSRAFETERSKSWINETPQEIARELDQTLYFAPASSGASGLQQDNRRALLALGILVLLVLLIACGNVANLMVAQAAARAREMALRVSIGAGRRQLVQLVLVESTILALFSSALGSIFAWWSAPFVVSMINPPDNPVRLALPADWRVLAFSFALALTVAGLFGLIPALRASAIQPAGALKGSPDGSGDPHARRRLMYALIAVQVAFCCLVLFVAGLFVATFEHLSNQPTGFSTDRLLVLDTVSHAPVSPVIWLQLADQLRSIPGVERVSVANRTLLDHWSNNNSVSINGSAPSSTLSYFLHVSPGWLETMKIPLLGGRDFCQRIPHLAMPSSTRPLRRLFSTGKIRSGGLSTDCSPTGTAHTIKLWVSCAMPVIAISAKPLSPSPTCRSCRPRRSRGWSAADTRCILVLTTSANPLALASTLRQAVPKTGSEFRVSRVRTQLEINQSQTIRERSWPPWPPFSPWLHFSWPTIGLYERPHLFRPPTPPRNCHPLSRWCPSSGHRSFSHVPDPRSPSSQAAQSVWPQACSPFAP